MRLFNRFKKCLTFFMLQSSHSQFASSIYDPSKCGNDFPLPKDIIQDLINSRMNSWSECLSDWPPFDDSSKEAPQKEQDSNSQNMERNYSCQRYLHFNSVILPCFLAHVTLIGWKPFSFSSIIPSAPSRDAIRMLQAQMNLKVATIICSTVVDILEHVVHAENDKMILFRINLPIVDFSVF